MPKNEIVITKIYEDSIASEAGIEAGDVLLKINGEEVHDTIEYRYLTCDDEIELVLKKANGEEYVVEIEKDAYEDIGIEFLDLLLENSKHCSNKCIFCFIDQLPKGMRKTLYFKDDDSRLSFLQGNFITLTNLNDDDFRRIIKYKISPINISVHTTNPELRVKMLNNRKADTILERIKELSEGGIQLNCQIVLCPGINDGEELRRTLKDLLKFYPSISNVAIVPVGITKYRDNLYSMEGYNEESSNGVIELVEKMQAEFKKEVNDNFARLSDEFYITAKREIQDYEHYGDFEQLEDGIGMTRYFETIIDEELEFVDFNGNKAEIAFVTGEMCSEYLFKIKNKIEEKLNIKITLYVIKNNFFGGKVSVAGLLTGKDIIEQIQGTLKEALTFIPRNMLKADEDIFLDDVTVEELENKLGTKIITCKYTGEDLIEKITNEVIKWQSQ